MKEFEFVVTDPQGIHAYQRIQRRPQRQFEENLHRHGSRRKTGRND